MKKKNYKAELEKLLSEPWMDQLDSEIDPADTMNHLNRMALVTGEITGRIGMLIEELEKKKKK